MGSGPSSPALAASPPLSPAMETMSLGPGGSSTITSASTLRTANPLLQQKLQDVLLEVGRNVAQAGRQAGLGKGLRQRWASGVRAGGGGRLGAY